MSDPVLTIAEGGVEIPRPAHEAAALGATVQDPAIAEAGAAMERRRRMFDRPAMKAQTFAEGVVDAFLLGFAHETGEEADIRRDVNAGAAFVGEAVGTVAAALTGVGPAARAMKVGERVGRVAAQSVLRQGERSIATAALGEAGAAAAQVGAMSFGHQFLDAVIEDRPFSGEAIIDDVQLAGVLGLVGGGLMGSLRKAGTRAEVRAQGGLVSGEGVLPQVKTAVRAYDEALDFHAQQLGALKELRRVGRLADVSDDFLRVREAALREADSARANLRELDLEDALSGADPAAYSRLQKDSQRYFAAMDEVETLMRPAPAELAVEAGEMYPAAAPEVAPIQAPDLTPTTPHQAIGPSAGTSVGHAPRNDLAALQALAESLPVPASGAEQGRALHRLTMEAPPASTKGGVALDGAGPGAATPTRPDKWTRKEVADHFVEQWHARAPERVRPWDEAQAKATQAMQELYLRSGGRFDSARALGVLERDGLTASGHSLGATLDQVYSMNRAAHLASLESKGIPTTLRDAAAEMLTSALGSRISRAALGGALSGPMGMVLGFTKFGGRLAAASGRLAMRVTEAVGKFMTSTKVRAVVVPSANHDWTYSEKGPIKDPVARIQEIQFLAANPDAVRQHVLRSAGDLAMASPDLTRAIADVATLKLQRLAMRAPAIYFDRLGRPLSPPQGKLREFFEYENASHDLGGILKSLAAGVLSRSQALALSEQWPSVHVRVAQGMLLNPDALQKMSRGHLRTVEMVTGVPLTGAADPMFLVRQQQAWQPTAPPIPPGKPQAFNINPEGAPTPSQANAQGRAPGN